MKRFFLCWLALTAAVVAGLSVLPTSRANMVQMPLGAGGVCTAAGTTAANNFINRTTGMAAATKTAMTSFICGLVSDGVITGNLGGSISCGAPLDLLYVFATTISADSLLNLCGTAGNATLSATAPTFTTNTGWNGTFGSTTIYVDSTLIPSTPATGASIAQNSASIGVWAIGGGPPIAAEDAGAQISSPNVNYAVIVNWAGFTYCDVNSSNTDANRIKVTAPAANGLYLCNRDTATTEQLYYNATTLATATVNSTGLPNIEVYVDALNATAGVTGTSRQLALAFFGSSVTAAKAAAIYNRGCAYLQAVHGSC
jgi:hypothetical protein